MIDLQGTMTHNVKTVVTYYKEIWLESKYQLLFVKNPLDKVPMALEKRFRVITKYETTYKKHVFP